MMNKLGVLRLVLLVICVVLTYTLWMLAGEVSKREMIESAQRQVESDAYDMMASNPVPTVICVDGKIVLWNQGMELMTGKKSGEMIGESSVTVVPEEYKERHTKAIVNISRAPGSARGQKFFVLPVDTPTHGRIKPLATVHHMRRYDGRVVMIARFVGVVFNRRLRWLDVTDGKYYTVTPRVEEVTPEGKPVEKIEK